MSRIRLQIDQNLIKTGHIIENSDWRKEYGGRMGRIESRECGFDCLLGKDSELFNFWQDFEENDRFDSNHLSLPEFCFISYAY